MTDDDRQPANKTTSEEADTLEIEAVDRAGHKRSERSATPSPEIPAERDASKCFELLDQEVTKVQSVISHELLTASLKQSQTAPSKDSSTAPPLESSEESGEVCAEEASTPLIPSVEQEPEVIDSCRTEKPEEPNQVEDPEPIESTQVPWFSTRPIVFVAAFALSILFHIVFFALITSDYFKTNDLDVQFEWMLDAGELTGLGMESGGRWADVTLYEPNKKEPEELESDLEPLEEKEEEPHPKPEEPESPKPVAKPSPKPPEESKPKPKPRRKKPLDPFLAKNGQLAGVSHAGPSKIPDMRGYGPGNMLYSSLIRLDRIRGTVFESITREIIKRVPDFRIALEHTGVDPLTELDALFSASSRPRYIQHTFLAVRYSIPENTLKSKLNQRFADNPPWRRSRGVTLRNIVPKDSPYQDPREIVLARPGLALIIRPEWLNQLVSSISEDSDLGRSIHPNSGQKRPTLLDGLMHIENAMTSKDTLIALSGRGIRLALPGLGNLRFQSIKFALSNAKAPKVNIDIEFADPETAEKFASSCGELKENVLQRLPFLVRGLANNILAPLKCESEQNFVSIQASYTVSQINQLVSLAMPFIPAPSVLNELPPPPPPPLKEEVAETTETEKEELEPPKPSPVRHQQPSDPNQRLRELLGGG